jgi:hypothetical protein
MKSLFTEEKLILAKSNDLLPCECYFCHKTYYQCKHEIQAVLNPNHNKKGKYCSKKCQSLSQITKVKVVCKNCNSEFEKYYNKAKKSSNHFCSQSCAATYNNKHKTNGYRRSKLEKYLELELIKLYPDLEFHFNRKDTINSELDIYIPRLKLAFELNGIFHYEPIYGKECLNQIQNNDQRKFQACIEHGIELCIIDSSQQKYFKTQTSEKYLNIIKNIINNKLVLPHGIEPCPLV